jgi:hypothetical protein
MIRLDDISITLPIVLNNKQTLGPRSGPAAYARAVRRYNIVYVEFHHSLFLRGRSKYISAGQTLLLGSKARFSRNTAPRERSLKSLLIR